MAWIESHQELRDHPKTRRLARYLGIHVREAVGLLHFLWWWALDYAEDGDLSRFEAADIADAILWDGDPEQAVDALVRAGFLDRTDSGLVIHDWDEYAGRLVEQRRKNRERKRRSRARHADVTRDTQGRHGATIPNPTEPNQTNAAAAAPAREDEPESLPTTPYDRAPDGLAEVERVYHRLTGRMLSGKDMPLACDVLQLATPDQIIRAIERGVQQFRPAYAGDRINSFAYFVPIVYEVVAEDSGMRVKRPRSLRGDPWREAAAALDQLRRLDHAERSVPT